MYEKVDILKNVLKEYINETVTKDLQNSYVRIFAQKKTGNVLTTMNNVVDEKQLEFDF